MAAAEHGPGGVVSGCHLGQLGWGRIAVLVKARVRIGRSWDDVVVDVRHYLGGKGAWKEDVSR